MFPTVPSPAERAVRAARPIRRARFASDLHLHGGDREGIERALRFLADARAQDVDALFLLGDVFRAWLGPRSLRDPGLRPFLSALAAASAAGQRVVLAHGNHDFMCARELEQALGVEVVGEALDVALGGQRARLLHGDAFCTLDVSYHRLHAVIRSAPFRALVRRLPARVAEGLARVLLAAAHRGARPKTEAETSIVDDDVRRVLQAGADLVVCGHVHRSRDRRFGAGRLVVLSDFERTGSHARWEDGALTLVRCDERYAPAPGPVLAIDGPAGSGKSSVARRVAAALGWAHLDSGALYRAVTWHALRGGLFVDGAPPDGALGRLARELGLELDVRGGLLFDGRSIDDAELRGAEVARHVSRVAADPEVRAALLPVQRALARRARGLVAEGRDMASVVFPEAVARVYLDARPEVRQARRARQAGGAGAGEAADNLAERDRIDSSRAHAPLRVVATGDVLDTSDLDLDGVVAQVLRRLGPATGLLPGSAGR